MQLDITLKVAIEEQKVTVAADNNSVSTEPENNAGAVVLKGADIDALPDDPDDLAAALQALAGPSAGPNGGQIFVDGFRMVLCHRALRFARFASTQILFQLSTIVLVLAALKFLTKPGTDRFRGQASFNFNDDALNARNPFATTRPPHPNPSVWRKL